MCQIFFNDILVGMHKFNISVLFVLSCNIYDQIDFICYR